VAIVCTTTSNIKNSTFCPQNEFVCRAGISEQTVIISPHNIHGFFISVINQLDVQNFCFTISLFHASTCFEHMCSSPGGQNCITQPLVSSNLLARNIVKQKFCASSWLITEINILRCTVSKTSKFMDWFLYRRRSVFTARYELNLYIQICVA